MAELKISELEYLGAVASFDTMEIPIDNGQNTYRITVEDFNERGTTSAQNQAAAAAASAADALEYKNAAATSESNALSYKNSAVSAKESAESAAVDALAYKNAAQSAANDAEGYRDTMRTATATTTADVALCEAAANDANTAKGLAQSAATSAANSSGDAQSFAYDSEAYARGTMGGTELPEGTPFYHNNSKWYSEQAASSASSAASSALTCATAVVKGPYIGVNGNWYVWSWPDEAYVDTNIAATGPAGKGIVSVAKTSSSGKVDTYTMTFTDNTTFDYTVTNGEDGQGSGDMLMTDYDHDQDVFNVGGIPAYVSSAIAAGTTNKLNKDGSNADVSISLKNVNAAVDDAAWYVNSVTKASGTGENVTIIETVGGDSGNLVYGNTLRLRTFYSSRVGCETYYLDGTDKVIIIIDSVTSSLNPSETEGTLTVTGHLKEDFSDAISLSTTTLYFNNYIDSQKTGNIIRGEANAIKGSGSATGRWLSVAADYSVAEGDNNSVGANYAHVEGQSNTVMSLGGHAEGTGNYCDGQDCHIEGNHNYASAPYGHIEGYYNFSTNAYQHIQGKYNSNKSTTLFEIGNGTAENARSNAFEVYDTGYISQNNGTDKYKFAKSGGLDGFYDGSGNFHPFEPLYLEQSVTLSTSADTTVTFTNAAIATTSRIDPYTSDYTVVPTNVVATTGSCTVTFKKVSTAVTITVGIEVKN